MVQPARARAHPPSHDRTPAPRNRTRHDRRLRAIPVSAGSTSLRAHGCTASTARCKSSDNSQATKSRPPRGKRKFFPKRIAGYKPEYLDRLCYSGEVMWGRLAPHPALLPTDEERKRRVRPTKLAPISLFPRAEAHELIARTAGNARRPLARRARRAGRDRTSRRTVLRRDHARCETPPGGSGRSALATRRGRPHHRRRFRCAPLVDRRETPSRRRGPSRTAALVRRPLDAARRGNRKRSCRKFRPKIARALGRRLPRHRLARIDRAALARRPHGAAKMEARGEVRGGRFIAAIVGEQFALPDAIDALRAARREGGSEALRTVHREEATSALEVSGYDPLAIVNAYLPEARSRRRTHNRNRRFFLVIERSSRSERSRRANGAPAMQRRPHFASTAILRMTQAELPRACRGEAKSKPDGAWQSKRNRRA